MQISFSAVGRTVEVSADEVLRILTDLFQIFVEQSSSHETSISIRGIGTIQVQKSRELTFQQELTQNEPLSQRKIKDRYQFMDNISTTISSGRGYACSVRSSKAGLSSVMTPATDFSVSSSVSKTSRSHKAN